MALSQGFSGSAQKVDFEMDRSRRNYRLVGAPLASIEAYEARFRQLVKRPQKILFSAVGQGGELAYRFRLPSAIRRNGACFFGDRSVAPASSDWN